MELRDYQADAIGAIHDWFRARKGNPLVVAPTGAGKSMIQAGFIQGAVQDWPATRVLCLTHVKELIAQNFAALIRAWPSAPAEIYSAGLNRKRIGQITFAGVQSFVRMTDRGAAGHWDLLIVDEAHLIPAKGATTYRKVINALMAVNPKLKVIGLTATPYRLDSGRLDAGDDPLFDGVCYDIRIKMLVERGYLSPLISKRPASAFDTEGLHKRGGEFIDAEIDARFNVDEVTSAALNEAMELGEGRKAWLAFCCSVDHARAVRDGLRARGVSAETVTGLTPAGERAALLGKFKSGQVKALTSVGVLTTGFDAPATDLILMMRPTQSIGLYVQIAGRGMRTAPGKTDCLVLDFAGNVDRHGPVDAIEMPPEKKKPEVPGEAPMKVCPECGSDCFISATECPTCGAAFPEHELGINGAAGTESIMMLTAPKREWEPVLDIGFAIHTKAGSPDSLRVTYLVGIRAISEWVCFDHDGFALRKAVSWWRARCIDPTDLVPASTAEALARVGELQPVTGATLSRDGKYHRIEAVRFDAQSAMEAAE
jgi:DNA repair protein RadD